MYSQTRINVVICQDGKGLANQKRFFFHFQSFSKAPVKFSKFMTFNYQYCYLKKKYIEVKGWKQ